MSGYLRHERSDVFWIEDAGRDQQYEPAEPPDYDPSEDVPEWALRVPPRPQPEPEPEPGEVG